MDSKNCTQNIDGIYTLHIYYLYLLFKSHKIVGTSRNFINCLSAIFGVQNVLIPPFLILPTTTNVCQHLLLLTTFSTSFTNIYSLLVPFTIFCHLLPIFTNFCTTISSFQQLWLIFTTFYQLLYYFSQLVHPLLTFSNFYQLLLPSTKFYTTFSFFIYLLG